MSEREILSLNNHIEKMLENYAENISIKDVVYDLIVTKNIVKKDVRDLAIYSEYIKMIKSGNKSITQIYCILSDKWNLHYQSIQAIVLKRSKCC
jgi:hypothetical protein